jgi:hypothetical protein
VPLQRSTSSVNARSSPSSGASTGRPFEGVDEIYIFQARDGRLASAIGVEDNLSRMRQLGIRWRGRKAEAEP